MAYLLGAAAVMESLQTDVRDVQSCVADIISRVGPVQLTSWKFPDKVACDLDIEDLLDLYSYSDEEEERQVAHIALYELVIDRLVLLLHMMATYTEGLLRTARAEVEPCKNTGTSVGVVVKKYWSRLSQLQQVVKQAVIEKNTMNRKVNEMEDDVRRLNSELKQARNTNVRPKTAGMGGLIPPNKAEMITGLSFDPSQLKQFGLISRDEYNKSCQTNETAFTPCDSCSVVQKSFRQSGEIIVSICQQQQIPSCLQKFRPQVSHLDWLSGNDISRWSTEQNKDLQRISKLTATIKPLKEELSDTHQRKDKLENRVLNFDRDMKKEKEERSVMHRQYESKIKEMETQFTQTMELEKQQMNLLEQNKQELEKLVEKHKHDLHEQQSLLKNLENTKSKLEEELSSNKVNTEEVQRLEEEMTGLQHKLGGVSTEMEKSSKELQKEQAKFKNAAKNNQSLQTKQQSLLQRIDALDQENRELQDQVADLEEEKEKFEDSVNEVKRETTQLERKLREKESEIEQALADKESLEQTISTLETSLDSLTEKLEEAKERERLIVDYPDINGPVNPDITGTGDILVDMENQVKANNIRIQLLEKQNEGLRNSVSKMLQMQQQQQHQHQQQEEPEDDGKWATHVQVRQQNGQEYPAETLRHLCRCIWGHLRDTCHRYDLNIFDRTKFEFAEAHKCLDGRMKALNTAGVQPKKKAKPVNFEEEAVLWERVFSKPDALSLQYTIYFYMHKVFGLRSATEHDDLQVGNFQFGDDEEGHFIRFVGVKSRKLHCGLKQRNVEVKDIKQYSDPSNPRCVVKLFHRYMDLIPSSGPFYRRPLASKDGKPRYSQQKAGINSLQKYLQRICEAAGIGGDKTRDSDNVRRQNGQEYPAETLRQLCLSIWRHLRDMCHRYDLNFFDRTKFEFTEAHKCLEGRMKALNTAGVQAKKQAEPVNLEEEEEVLWERVFSKPDALSLQYTIYFYMHKVFGLRSATEHDDLQVGNFQFGDDEEGHFIRFVGVKSRKIHCGLKQRNVEVKDIKQYSDPSNPRCVVKLFHRYMDLIPSSGPFYRRPLASKDGKPRYSQQKAGIHALQKYVQRICEAAGISGDKTRDSDNQSKPQPLWNKDYLHKQPGDHQCSAPEYASMESKYNQSSLYNRNFHNQSEKIHSHKPSTQSGIQNIHFDDGAVKPGKSSTSSKERQPFGHRPLTGSSAKNSGSEFLVGKAVRPESAKVKHDSRSPPGKGRPLSGKALKNVPAQSASAISAYIQLKKAGKLSADSNYGASMPSVNTGSRPATGKTRVPTADVDLESNYSKPDNFMCTACDKMYTRERDLEIHMSYCTG